jgi:hypothetical protein
MLMYSLATLREIHTLLPSIESFSSVLWDTILSLFPNYSFLLQTFHPLLPHKL